MANLNIDFGPPGGLDPAPRARPRKIKAGAASVLAALGVAVLISAVAGLLGPKFGEGPRTGDANLVSHPPEDAGRQAAFSNVPGDEKVRAAENMDLLLRNSIELTTRYISYVDIESTDGHLIVMLAERYGGMTAEGKREIEAGIATIWRGTKYVREMGFGRGVTFVEPRGKDPKDALVRTDNGDMD